MFNFEKLSIALLNLSRELGYLTVTEFELLYVHANKISKMINGLIKSLEEK